MLRQIVGPSIIILLAGSATSGLLRPSPADPPSPPAHAPAAAPTQRSPGERPVHGGPIERLHDPADCGKPIVALKGGPPGLAGGEVGPPPHAQGKAKGRSRPAIGG